MRGHHVHPHSMTRYTRLEESRLRNSICHSVLTTPSVSGMLKWRASWEICAIKVECFPCHSLPKHFIQDRKEEGRSQVQISIRIGFRHLRLFLRLLQHLERRLELPLPLHEVLRARLCRFRFRVTFRRRKKSRYMRRVSSNSKHNNL